MDTSNKNINRTLLYLIPIVLLSGLIYAITASILKLDSNKSSPEIPILQISNASCMAPKRNPADRVYTEIPLEQIATWLDYINKNFRSFSKESFPIYWGSAC